MDFKPIKPKEHGIIDYVFSAVQLMMPAAIGLNKETTITYQALGTGFLATNALTDTPVGIKPLIPWRAHQKADISFLAGLSLLTFYKPIRTDKRALAFHLAILGGAVANYYWTDYKDRRRG